MDPPLISLPPQPSPPSSNSSSSSTSALSPLLSPAEAHAANNNSAHSSYVHVSDILDSTSSSDSGAASPMSGSGVLSPTLSLRAVGMSREALSANSVNSDTPSALFSPPMVSPDTPSSQMAFSPRIEDKFDSAPCASPELVDGECSAAVLATATAPAPAQAPSNSSPDSDTGTWQTASASTPTPSPPQQPVTNVQRGSQDFVTSEVFDAMGDEDANEGGALVRGFSARLVPIFPLGSDEAPHATSSYKPPTPPRRVLSRPPPERALVPAPRKVSHNANVPFIHMGWNDLPSHLSFRIARPVLHSPPIEEPTIYRIRRAAAKLAAKRQRDLEPPVPQRPVEPYSTSAPEAGEEFVPTTELCICEWTEVGHGYEGPLPRPNECAFYTREHLDKLKAELDHCEHTLRFWAVRRAEMDQELDKEGLNVSSSSSIEWRENNFRLAEWKAACLRREIVVCERGRARLFEEGEDFVDEDAASDEVADDESQGPSKSPASPSRSRKRASSAPKRTPASLIIEQYRSGSPVPIDDDDDGGDARQGRSMFRPPQSVPSPKLYNFARDHEARLAAGPAAGIRAQLGGGGGGKMNPFARAFDRSAEASTAARKRWAMTPGFTSRVILPTPAAEDEPGPVGEDVLPYGSIALERARRLTLASHTAQSSTTSLDRPVLNVGVDEIPPWKVRRNKNIAASSHATVIPLANSQASGSGSTRTPTNAPPIRPELSQSQSAPMARRPSMKRAGGDSDIGVVRSNSQKNAQEAKEKVKAKSAATELLEALKKDVDALALDNAQLPAPASAEEGSTGAKKDKGKGKAKKRDSFLGDFFTGAIGAFFGGATDSSKRTTVGESREGGYRMLTDEETVFSGAAWAARKREKAQESSSK